MLYYNQYLSVLLFLIITKKTLQKDEVRENYVEKMTSKSQRRFIDDLDDKEFHISHLRDMEFDTEDCEEDTFEDKVKKYRETLKNDAALVEFVSGDTIHVDEKEVTKGKCNKNINDIFKTKEKLKSKSTLKVSDNTKEQEGNVKSVDGEVKTATVGVEVDDQDKTVKNDSSNRRSEYQFSSAEYYDEVPDFDHSICPDTVDVITLEIDQLRNYDVECEAIIEWRSLE